MPAGVAQHVREKPLRILDQYRARVAELGPEARTILSERDTVLTTFAGGKQVQLLVSDPGWGSSPMVTMSVHERVPGGMGEVERSDFHPFSYQQKKADGSKEWVLDGASVGHGLWAAGTWVGTSETWLPVGRGDRYVVTASTVTGPASWRATATNVRHFLASRRGLKRIEPEVAARMNDTARGGYSLKNAPYFVGWSDLRKAGVHPVIDSRGRHSIRSSSRLSREKLRDLDVTYVKRSKNGRRAHLRGRGGK